MHWQRSVGVNGDMGIIKKTPVPSDIEIAQAATLKPISEIAQRAGLVPEEFDTHGPSKAKVCCV